LILCCLQTQGQLVRDFKGGSIEGWHQCPGQPVRISGAMDVFGRVMDPFQGTVCYRYTCVDEVVISEIMADPTPSAGLPGCEYVELHNTGPWTVALDGWRLFCDDDAVELDGAVVMPHSYLILSGSSCALELARHGEVFSVDPMPNLLNTGESLHLENGSGRMISCVSYSDEWYGDGLKKDGGWSLEQVDACNPCAGQGNWAASTDPLGGTPGRVNSVEDTNPDFTPPALLFVGMPDSLTVLLEFDEPLAGADVVSRQSYHVQGLGLPRDVRFYGNRFHLVELIFTRPFRAGIKYHLTIRGRLEDCAGNLLSGAAHTLFELPELPGASDVVINEVLYDPWPGGTEYVEIYNRSSTTIDLSNLYMATLDDSSPTDHYYPLSFTSRLFFPGSYLVCTRQPEIVAQHYIVEDPGAMMGMERMPVLTNRGARLVLAGAAHQTIDRLEYSEAMHFPLYGKARGASLERVHFDRPSEDPSNWHTAAQSAGFGTPTYRNSQFSEPEAPGPIMTVRPQVFSPDQDGWDDLLEVHLCFDRPGYVASIKIYDARGRLVRTLADHQTTGTEKTFTWDGLDDNGRKARMGIYLIQAEAFHLSGDTKACRKACVLSGRL